VDGFDQDEGARKRDASQCFRLAEKCLRAATRTIVQSEADRAVVLDTARDNRETTR